MSNPITVTITGDELIREPAPWPGATFEDVAVTLMRRKGLTFRSCFFPTPDDLLPPWRAEHDEERRAFTITQGEA